MKMRRIFLTPVLISLLVIVPTMAAILVPIMSTPASSINSSQISSSTSQHPNFSIEQHVAMLHETQSELHPLWKDLSWSARVDRASMFARQFLQTKAREQINAVTGQAVSAQTSANFSGNLTVITAPSGQTIALQRQANCSLTLFYGTHTFSFTPRFQISGSTANYEQLLHSAAGLTTSANVFASGCKDPTLGVGTRRGVYLGTPTASLHMGAAAGYDMNAGSNALYFGSINPATQAVHDFNTNLSQPGIVGVTAGDLNKDGTFDIVGIDSTSASITVWLVNADGTLRPSTAYSLTGNTTEAAVVTDANGDGKLDVVVATRASSGQETISLLTGKGDGTLNAAQSISVATPSGHTISNLIAADIRGSGKMDLVGSNGVVLLNNGSGAFTAGASAFTPANATSSYGPNIVAADFNNDGKLDLAVNDGSAISIYTGNGAGVFTAGPRYASINNVGYMTATDLDGDGNVDLYVGMANSGAFGGDQFEQATAYALMGKGNGTFSGAPSLPFVHTGRNIADLNGDTLVDAIGVNTDLSFTSYLGDGKGGFSSKATITTSPISLGGSAYTLTNIDSYATGDINGDGKPDLAYIGANFIGPNFNPGVFIALGDGQGGFASPSFYPVPSTLAASDIDVNWVISNIYARDVNHDGRADLIYNYSDTSSHGNTLYFGTAIQLSNGDGTFQAPKTIPYRSAPYSGDFNPMQTAYPTLITDLNKDGNPDLIFIAQSPTIDHTLSTYTASMQVALGRGDGTFATPTVIAGPTFMVQSFSDVIPASIAVGDMNGDGITDIIALGASSTYTTQVAISLGNGDGTFKAPILTNYTTQYLNNSQGIAVADFNGDGKLDVVITNPYNQLGSGISLGNGDGTLQTAGNGMTLPNLAINLQVAGAIAATDINGDNKPDLVVGTTVLLTQSAVTPPATTDFSIAATSPAATVTAGQSTQTSISVTPGTGYTGTVSLSCSGLPSGSNCNFSPNSLSVANVAATSTLTITTTSRAVSVSNATGSFWSGGTVFAVFVPFAFTLRQVFAAFGIRAFSGLLIIGLGLLSGCGGGSSSGSASSAVASSSVSSSVSSSASSSSSISSSGTPAGTYSVLVTATDGTHTHTATYALTVN